MKPRLDELNKSKDALGNQCNSTGVENLKRGVKNAKIKHSKVNKVLESKITQITTLLNVRREFLSRLEIFGDQLMDFQSRLEALSEISTSDVQNSLEAHQILKSDVGDQKAIASRIGKEVKDLSEDMAPEEGQLLEQKNMELQKSYSHIADTVDKREQLLKQWLEFQKDREEMDGKLQTIQAQLESDDLKEDEIEQLKTDLISVKAVLNTLGGQCSDMDKQVQQLQLNPKDEKTQARVFFKVELSSLLTHYETLMVLLQQKQDKCEEKASMWKTYQDRKNRFLKWEKEVEAKAEALTSSGITPDALKAQLKELEIAEAELASAKDQLDTLHETGKQLAAEIEATRGAKPTDIEDDLDRTKLRHAVVAEKLDARKESLADQLSALDSLTASRDSLTSWLHSSQSDLSVAPSQFADSSAVQDRLGNFHAQLSEKEAELEAMKSKLAELKRLNPDADYPELETAVAQLERELENAKQLARNQEMGLQELMHQKTELSDVVEGLKGWLERTDDRLSGCEDNTKPDGKIVKQLKECRKTIDDIKAHQPNVDGIQTKLRTMSGKYPASDLIKLQEEIAAVARKHDELKNRSLKIQESLETTLQQRYEDATQDYSQWIKAAKSSLKSCADTAGDRAFIETKLDKLNELDDNIEEGRAKLANLNSKGEHLWPTLPDHKQDTIKHELAVGNEEFNTLTSDLLTWLDKLEECADLCQQFEEAFAKLSNWLKATEEKVKSQAGPKRDLGQKEDQLEEFKNVDDDVEKQSELVELVKEGADSLADISSSNAKVVSQVAQVTNTYNILANRVKEIVKQADQNVKDHQEYLESSVDFTGWIQDLKEEYASCAEPTGDRQACQAKLDKLKELLDLKDEGQSKLNDIVSKVHKVLPHTSQDGRDIIKDDLKTTKEEWESLMSSMHESKGRLEASLQQWGTYEDSYRQICEWLDDMEKQLNSDKDLKDDLHGKKLQLEKLKSLHQDIVADKPVVDTFISKAQEILQSGPGDAAIGRQASQVENRYQNVATKTKERLKLQEQYVQEHDVYNSALQDFTEYLKLTKDRFSSCAGLSGDKIVMETKLLKVQELLSKRHQGQSKLNNLTECASDVMPHTAPGGQDQIRNEIDSLQKEWADLIAQMQETRGNLDSSLERWNSFEDRYDQLAKWVREVEETLRSASELQPGLGEKKSQLERYKALDQDIRNHEPKLESISQEAQQIVQANASDIAVGSQASHLLSRYEGLKINSQDALKRIDSHIADHQQFIDAVNEFNNWLDDAEQTLQSCSTVSGDRADLEKKIETIKELQSSRPQGQVLLNQTVDTVHKILPHTAPAGRDHAKQQLQEAKEKWEKFLSDLSEAKGNLETSLVQWNSYEDNYEQILKWLAETENELTPDAISKLYPDLNGKKEHLEKYKAIQQDIVAHQSIVDAVTQKAQNILETNVGEINVAQQISDLSRRYQTVSLTAKDVVADTEKNVQEHLVYVESKEEFSDWLQSAKQKLASCSEPTGTRSTSEDSIRKLEELLTAKQHGQSKLNSVLESGEQVLSRTAPQGRDIIKVEMKEFKAEWEKLMADIGESKAKQETSLQQLTKFQYSFEQLLKWLAEVEDQLKAAFELQPGLPEKKNHLDKYKVLKDSITAHKSALDNINQKAQEIVQSTSGEVSFGSDVAKTSSQYESVVIKTEDVLRRLEQNVVEHKRYREFVTEAEKWLQAAKQKLDASNDTTGDKNVLESRLATVKDLLANKQIGQARLENAVSQGEKIMPQTAEGTRGRGIIKEEIESLKRDWESLCSQINHVKDVLEKCIHQWNSYEHSYEQTVRWLKDTEESLKSAAELQPHLNDKKSQLETYKSLQLDIGNHQDDVKKLTENAKKS
ncbi:nesprin-1-like isoform X2 [Ptychodera flava]|uniref:nesprin-1-like isoform X2 n=1 Tax=Ptychodera flava TaxID=63121 RepID=UPI003969CA74